MKYDYRQYKIDTLLRMAKTTGDVVARERYIAEADVELQQLCDECNVKSTFSPDNFYSECLVFDDITRTKRLDVFNAYLKYCKNTQQESIPKQAFYRFMRKIGVHSIKAGGGYECFCVKVELQDDSKEDEDD